MYITPPFSTWNFTHKIRGIHHQKGRTTLQRAVMTAALGVLLLVTSAFAQNFEVVADFGAPEGMEPYGGLIEGSDGYFYGTTASGGIGFGTIYRVDLTGTVETLFLFGGSNGSRPEGILLHASDGLLYGTTRLGGASLKGTIFKFNPSTGAFTLLRSFAGADGAEPRAGLVEAADGYLYGTTSSGGLSGCGVTACGTVFRITRAGAFNTVVKFNKTNGAIPVGGLAEALDGRLFGTTSKGGSQDRGTIFAVNLSGALSTLHAFSFTDGFSPYGTLLRATDGKFYGTTYAGGPGLKGTIFSVTTAGVFKLVHSFTGLEGSYPVGSLIEDVDGVLYGTSTMGGLSGKGTIFKLASGVVSRLFSLTTSSGASPNTKLARTAPGIFFGTMTSEGPPGSAGTVVKVTSGGALTVLHAFKGSPVKPYSTLVKAGDGEFLGSTRAGGGFGQGTIYSVDVDGNVALLHAFSGTDGGEPIGAVLKSTTGAVYATTTTSGANRVGTLVKRNTSGVVTVLASWSVSSGFPSYGGLVETPTGDIYGTTSNGGSKSLGTIFRMTSGGAFSVVHNFGGGDGANPYAGLVAGPSGELYGTTTGGGASGLGVIFSFDPGSGTYRRLASFNAGTGTSPKGELVYADDGYFYGTTMNSGAQGYGTIFRFDPGTNSITTLHSFTSAGGGNPYAGLTEGANSVFYGTTYVGGASNDGTVFKFNVNTRQYDVLHSFRGNDGAHPHGGVTLAGDGKLYGTTTSGGSTGNGIAFRVTPSSTTSFGVEVTVPNGGELLAKDAPVVLKWRPTGNTSAIRSFDVQFSANGGSTYNPIAGCTNLSASSLSCTWTSAGPATTSGRIRVIARDDTGKSANDESDANFTIGFVTLTVPDSAANWGIGSKQPIKWKHNVGKSTPMRIELSRDAGATWQVITAAAKNIDATTGAYAWIVAGPSTSQARVRISPASTPAIAAASAGNFTIAAPFITVNKPAAGTIWRYGSKETLSWKTNLGADKVTVLLSVDGGLTFPIVLVPSTAATQPITFSVPVLAAPTTKARIRVKWLDGPVQGTSPNAFAVKP